MRSFPTGQGAAVQQPELSSWSLTRAVLKMAEESKVVKISQSSLQSQSIVLHLSAQQGGQSDEEGCKCQPPYVLAVVTATSSQLFC